MDNIVFMQEIKAESDIADDFFELSFREGSLIFLDLL